MPSSHTLILPPILQSIGKVVVVLFNLMVISE